MDTKKTNLLNWRNKRTLDTVDKDAKVVLSDDTYISVSEIGTGSLTPDQRKAIDSGITAEKVLNYDNHILDSSAHTTAEEKEAWNGKYEKPSDGIPMNDLSQPVQDMIESVYEEESEALYIDGSRPASNG